MDPFDVLDKNALSAALRFCMQTEGHRPAMVSYYDGEFKVEILYENNDINNVVVSREFYIDNRKNVDHTISSAATLYLKTQMRMIQDQKARLQQMSAKFNG